MDSHVKRLLHLAAAMTCALQFSFQSSRPRDCSSKGRGAKPFGQVQVTHDADAMLVQVAHVEGSLREEGVGAGGALARGGAGSTVVRGSCSRVVWYPEAIVVRVSQSEARLVGVVLCHCVQAQRERGGLRARRYESAYETYTLL